MSKSFLNTNLNLPRGIRNNNPGNLVYTNIAWQGKIPYSQNTDFAGSSNNIVRKFEQFIDVRFGIRAMLRDILNDISKGKNTVTKLISEYAPAFENDTEMYIKAVANALGIGKDEPIKEVTNDFLLQVAKIIMQVENGKNVSEYITDEDINQAIDILGDTSGYGITISQKKNLFGNATKTGLLILVTFFCLFF